MKAFLSHSSRDKPLVEDVANYLGAAQVELDSKTFDSGLLNVAEIQTALKRCSIFVLFLTQDALDSSYVRFEALLAQELLAKGVIDKFLVVCLDPAAFAQAESHWKSFNFVRHLASPQSIARLIQNHLLMDRAKSASKRQPYVERSKELNELKELLIQPERQPIRGIYISGNAGIGRRTLARQLYRDRYPAVNAVFPEIQVDPLDGYEELYRKLSQELMPSWPLSNWRARVLGFAIADEKGKATQIANLFDELIESREAMFVLDGGGLLDSDGALQQPLTEILSRIQRRSYPTAVFIAERMIPRGRRADLPVVYIALPSMTDAQVRQLAGFLLTDAQIPYSNDDLEQIVSLSDGHPFNVKFLVDAAAAYTLPVALAETSDLTQWKHRRGSDFLRRINFTEDERAILGALRDFVALDFGTIQAIVSREIGVVGRLLAKLMDFHVIEAANETYRVAPPLRIAVGRDPRFALRPDERRAMLKVVSGSLNIGAENDIVSVSMVDAGILAVIEEGGDLPELFSAFLLPSQLVWLAKRHYDGRRWAECAQVSLSALNGAQRLSPAGKVEACRLLCLASARLDRLPDFQRGMAMLRTWANDSWARSNVSFLLGFQARLDGNMPQAETHLRQASTESPGNFNALRELAAICLARGESDEAEGFARRAMVIAPDNPYILDILLGVLISQPRSRLRQNEPEIAHLFDKLKDVGEEEGHSFYATRRAEYELKHGSIQEACRLIDIAVDKTPGIFRVHALRATIYLERGLKSVAAEEIEVMRRLVYRPAAGERRTNLRPLLEIEASYLGASGDYDGAKQIYAKRAVFTEDEAKVAIRAIDYERAMKKK